MLPGRLCEVWGWRRGRPGPLHLPSSLPKFLPGAQEAARLGWSEAPSFLACSAAGDPSAAPGSGPCGLAWPVALCLRKGKNLCTRSWVGYFRWKPQGHCTQSSGKGRAHTEWRGYLAAWSGAVRLSHSVWLPCALPRAGTGACSWPQPQPQRRCPNPMRPQPARLAERAAPPHPRLLPRPSALLGHRPILGPRPWRGWSWGSSPGPADHTNAGREGSSQVS